MKRPALLPALWGLIALGLLAGCATQGFPPPVPPPTPPISTVQDPAESGLAPERYQGVPVGFTEEGDPYWGSLKAPVTVYEYSDYQCPFCAQHVLQIEPALVERFVASGQMRLVFRDFPLEGLHPNAVPAALAARCVAEQGAALFWRMHDLLFQTQDQWAPLDDPGAFFARLAQDAGADPDRFTVCLAERADTLQQQIRASGAEARAQGYGGVPAFRFVVEANGEEYALVGAQPYRVFSAWMDALATGETPPPPEQIQGAPDERQTPFWATREGLAPDPDRPGYTRAGDPYRGDPEAPLVVVEFSDFRCPFCRQHAQTTQPVLHEQFVETGKVLWVFKHFPILGETSFAASVAAECAGQQGRFWEMYERLFQAQEAWAQANDPGPIFTRLAAAIGLDLEAFQGCRADEQVQAAVRGDREDGTPLVRGTPTFVILRGDRERLVPGALAVDLFVALLDQLHAEAVGQ